MSQHRWRIIVQQNSPALKDAKDVVGPLGDATSLFPKTAHYF
jgi:hypothetical protein